MRCDDFVTASDFKIKHNFLKHYKKEQNELFEDKPVDIETFRKITKYTISVDKFGRKNNNFENSEEVVEDSFKNVHSKFRPSCSKLIMYSFVI